MAVAVVNPRMALDTVLSEAAISRGVAIVIHVTLGTGAILARQVPTCLPLVLLIARLSLVIILHPRNHSLGQQELFFPPFLLALPFGLLRGTLVSTILLGCWLAVSGHSWC